MTEHRDISVPFGYSERFEIGEYERADRIVSAVRASGCRSLRVALSASEHYAPGGEEWHEWLLRRVASELELLPCLLYPSLKRWPLDARAALREVRAYTEFVDALLTGHGKRFSHLELCSPPNFHPSGSRPEDSWLLCAEILTANLQAARGGWNIVLGTQAPQTSTLNVPSAPQEGDAEAGSSNGPHYSDFYWVHALGQRGLLDELSAVSLQGLYREASWQHWRKEACALRNVLAQYGARSALWLTEGGYPAAPPGEARQVEHFTNFLQVPAERHYWCAWQDRAPNPQSTVTPHALGVIRADGQPKLLARLLHQDAPARTTCLDAWSSPEPSAESRPVVIIGGAGFIGCNLAKSFLDEGHPVVVLDNLSRPGVEFNLTWLRRAYGAQVHPLISDIREESRLTEVLGGARAVFHMAAQVAVTTSLEAPLEDFEVNALGTLRVLEALRATPRRVPLLYASTNKVYGDLADIELERTGSGYLPRRTDLFASGIDESRPLEFRTPYGCSKGVADQYVLDYARSYDIPTAVLRMSCIYGPRQFGTEDQGWVAHFLLRALRKEAITLYGDGWQVRDVLHVSDAVRAYRAVLESIEDVSGQAFNLGGGPENAVCLRAVLERIGSLVRRTPLVCESQPRQGDQLYFVADTRKLRNALGWQPSVGWREGLEDLWSWLRDLHELEAEPPTEANPPQRRLMA